MIRTLSVAQSEFSFRRGQVLTTAERDEAAFEVQQYALRNGFIPIAGIVSRTRGPDQHEILGAGHNWLAYGKPRIHGETGALIDMGVVDVDPSEMEMVSTLRPCPFCQCCMGRHVGIPKFRVLGAADYDPDEVSYQQGGIQLEIARHSGIEETFNKWVTESRNSRLWNRDIGIAADPAKLERPFQTHDWSRYLAVAHNLAKLAHAAGEAPLGVVIVDHLGEVAGSGYAAIKGTDGNLSRIAFMEAWGACGSRDDLGSHTVVTTAGADHIMWSGFDIFKFGQLVVASTEVFEGRTADVANLKGLWTGQSERPVRIAKDATSDQLLREWIAKTPLREVRRYLGADYQGLRHVDLTGSSITA